MLLAAILLSLDADAEEIIEINNLIENAKELDGQEVLVEGEAIGEEMERGDFSWVNINDGTNAIGVWLKNNDAEKITFYGSYKFKGDTVKVSGIFHRACAEHGGEADLHNMSFEIAEVGHPVNEQVPKAKIIAASVLSISALLLFLYFIRNRYLI
jgi:hypothetical protein